MDSWDSQTPSPDIKFENSPAESFLSTPGDMYPSLFGSSPATTMNPLEIMTPQSFTDEKNSDLSLLSGLTTSLPESPSTPGATASEKRAAKKRKSWGQVLPEPKTNLPPRKRAKTEDEKEQRRVERVLRNRRAAQSSRERKRLEVEALERRNQELESMLRQVQQTNLTLVEELHKFQRTSGVVPRSSPPFDGLRPNPVTFSQELFGSQDGHSTSLEHGNRCYEDLLMSTQSNSTVNPAALSPALSPVADEEEDEPATPDEAVGAATPENTSPDATQHPAVSVGGSVSVVADGVPITAPSGSSSALAAPASSDLHVSDAFSMSAALDADRYVLESGLLASPNSLDLEYDHLAGDDTSAFPFPPTGHQNMELFDINEFLNDELNVLSANEQQQQQHPDDCAVADSSLLDPKTQISPEDPIQQPHSGASTYGCDDGGIAVGVI